MWGVGAIGHALALAGSMTWEILWALILGFALSAVVQAVVRKSTIVRLLGDDRPRTLAVAAALGAASSSCSYAAVALARSLFRKGANFTAAMAFEIGSTNLVVELGVIMALLLGWQFTVAEFVEYFALLKDVPPRQVPRSVAAAVEQVGLGDKARSRLRTLSGGMLRRAGIAQAIVNQPELLLLDEPTAGLDPEQRVAFRALLRDLGERSTVIVSTHLVEDVGAACGEVALMDAGKVVFQGTPDELTARGEGTGAAGDAPLERGYSAVLAAARSVTAVRS